MEPEPAQEVRKKPSLLSEVLVSGLLKNINEKVTNKLDQEAQSELAGIVSQRVKQGGMRESEQGISWDDLPSQDHLLPSANKGRVSPPRNKLSSTARTDRQTDSLEEDFENLLKDEEIDIADTSEQVEGKAGGSGGGGGGEVGGDDSYLDDFEALLADSSAEVRSDCDEDKHCDIEADFDALIEEENVLVEEQIYNKSELSQGENIKEESQIENKQEDSDDKEPDLEGTDDNDEPLVCDENINEESNMSIQSEETEQELSEPVLERSRSVSEDLWEQEESIPSLEVDIVDQQQSMVEGKEVADNCQHVQVADQPLTVLSAWLAS